MIRQDQLDPTLPDVEAERAALDALIAGRTLCSELAGTAARHGDLDALSWETGGERRPLVRRTIIEHKYAASIEAMYEPRGTAKSGAYPDAVRTTTGGRTS